MPDPTPVDRHQHEVARIHPTADLASCECGRTRPVPILTTYRRADGEGWGGEDGPTWVTSEWFEDHPLDGAVSAKMERWRLVEPATIVIYDVEVYADA